MNTTVPAAVPLVEKGEAEVLAKAKRRTFTAAEKLRVLGEADACTKRGEIGALLRREGIYSSSMTAWRRARERGELGATKKRGPAARARDDRDRKIVELERELRRATARAERAEALVEIQKKLAKVLGLSVDESGEESR